MDVQCMQGETCHMALGGISVLPTLVYSTILRTFLLTSFRDAGEVTEDREK